MWRGAWVFVGVLLWAGCAEPEPEASPEEKGACEQGGFRTSEEQACPFRIGLLCFSTFEAACACTGCGGCGATLGGDVFCSASR